MLGPRFTKTPKHITLYMSVPHIILKIRPTVHHNMLCASLDRKVTKSDITNFAYRSPHSFSTKLSPILVIPFNFFANFGNFFIIFFVYSLQFSLFLVNDFHQYWWHFQWEKGHQFWWLFIEFFVEIFLIFHQSFVTFSISEISLHILETLTQFGENLRAYILSTILVFIFLKIQKSVKIITIFKMFTKVGENFGENSTENECGLLPQILTRMKFILKISLPTKVLPPPPCHTKNDYQLLEVYRNTGSTGVEAICHL